jgi:hypothetical protein
MAFRFRLIDAGGTDLGPFVSKRQDWKPAERIGRSKGEDILITGVIEPEQDAGFQAYLVVFDPRRQRRIRTRQPPCAGADLRHRLVSESPVLGKD